MTTWTNGPPTEPGVYWVRAKGRRISCVVVVRRWRRKLYVADSHIVGGPAGLGDIRKHCRILEPDAEPADPRAIEGLLRALHERIAILTALIPDPPDYHRGLDLALRARGCRPREGCDWLGRRVPGEGSGARE